MQNPRILLLVGDQGILCVPHKIADAPAPFFAPPTDQGISQMLNLAVRNPRVPVTLLADTLSQDLRRDILPRLNLFDRTKLIRRRLQQAFPQARLTASLKVAADRRQILLAGIQGDGPLFHWLTRFGTTRPACPPQISLLPVEAAGMAAKLLPRTAQSWNLLIGRQRCGGFRQIVSYKGELVFTRLTPPLSSDASPETIIASIARDIEASRGYLGRLGLAGDAPLPAVLLLPTSYQDQLARTALLVHEPLLLSPHEAACKLGLPFATAADDPYSDVLFASWFISQKRPLLALMPPDLRRTQRTALIRRWGWRMACASLLLAIGLIGWNASGLASIFIEREKESVQLSALQQEFAQEQSMAAPVTEPLGRLRQALERQRLFTEPMPGPWAAMRLIDNGLDAEARLTKLEWRDDTGKSADEQIHIETRLTGQPADADREATVERFRQVAQNLARTMPNYSVDVVHFPFPALPREALSNDKPKDKAPDTTAALTLRRIP